MYTQHLSLAHQWPLYTQMYCVDGQDLIPMSRGKWAEGQWMFDTVRLNDPRTFACAPALGQNKDWSYHLGKCSTCPAPAGTQGPPSSVDAATEDPYRNCDESVWATMGAYIGTGSGFALALDKYGWPGWGPTGAYGMHDMGGFWAACCSEELGSPIHDCWWGNDTVGDGIHCDGWSVAYMPVRGDWATNVSANASATWRDLACTVDQWITSTGPYPKPEGAGYPSPGGQGGQNGFDGLLFAASYGEVENGGDGMWCEERGYRITTACNINGEARVFKIDVSGVPLGSRSQAANVLWNQRGWKEMCAAMSGALYYNPPDTVQWYWR
jgi:hypothetical protein